MKLPLLRRWMLQCPALRGTGLATVFAILRVTSRTMASAARALTVCSKSLSLKPPSWRTMILVIVGTRIGCLGGGRGCLVVAAAASAPAYNAGVGFAYEAGVGAEALAFIFPFAFLLRSLWVTSMKVLFSLLVRCVWFVGAHMLISTPLGEGHSLTL